MTKPTYFLFPKELFTFVRVGDWLRCVYEGREALVEVVKAFDYDGARGNKSYHIGFKVPEQWMEDFKMYVSGNPTVEATGRLHYRQKSNQWICGHDKEAPRVMFQLASCEVTAAEWSR